MSGTKSTTVLKVAVLQFSSSADCEKNFSLCKNLIVAAANEGASFLCLPECFHFIGDGTIKSYDVAETLDIDSPLNASPTIRKYQKLAQDLSVGLSLGGFPELSTEKGKVFNSHIIIAPDGRISSIYRKIHLFDYKSGNLMESSFTTAGDDLVVDTCTGSKIGLSTCYDVRFPEMYTSLRSLGANVLLVPAAFTVATGRAHWEVLLRARAIENQCFVLAAAQIGQHNDKRASFGGSMIIDPWGKVLARCADCDNKVQKGEREIFNVGVFALADLDFYDLTDIREKMPVKKHTRFSAHKIPEEK